MPVSKLQQQKLSVETDHIQPGSGIDSATFFNVR